MTKHQCRAKSKLLCNSMDTIYLCEHWGGCAGVERIIDGFDMSAWEEIARLGPSGRTPEECWKQWTHQLRPSLNQGPWRADEDARLLQLVKSLGTHAVSSADKL